MAEQESRNSPSLGGNGGGGGEDMKEDVNAPINIKVNLYTLLFIFFIYHYHFLVQVVTSQGDETYFKIKRSTKLSKLQGAYASKVGKDVSSIRLVFCCVCDVGFIFHLPWV